MRSFILLIVFILSPFISQAQCESFDKSLAQGNRYAQKNNYQKAVESYTASMIACPDRAQEASKKLVKVFDKVNGLKGRAERALAQSQKLISYFGFPKGKTPSKDDRAWAFNVEKGKFALINGKGDLYTKFLYTEPQRFRSAQVVVFKQNGYVILDKYGKELTEELDIVVPRASGGYLISDQNGQKTSYLPPSCKFSGWYNGNISHVTSDLIPVQNKEQYGFINQKGELVLPLVYDWLNFIKENGLAKAKRGKLYGFIDQTGKEVIPFIYSSAHDFFNNRAWVIRDNTYYCIDETGKELFSIPSIWTESYDYQKNFSEGLSVLNMIDKSKKTVTDEMNYGYLDRTGKVLIPPSFKSASPFSEGLASVTSSDYQRNSFIDTTGKEVFQLQEGETEYDGFSEGLVQVYKNPHHQIGYANTSGKLVIPFMTDYHEAGLFKNGLASVRYDKKHGYIDRTGKLTVPLYLDKTTDYKDSTAAVKVGSRWIYINAVGKEITPQQEYYSDNLQFSEGIAGVNKDEKYGYINAKGETIIPAIYDYVAEFFEGHAIVSTGDHSNRKISYINRTGTKIISSDPTYKQQYRFSNELALVEIENNNNNTYIDLTGKPLNDVHYYNAKSFSEGLAQTCIKGKGCGYIDTTGTMVFNTNYQQQGDFSDGLAWGQTNSKEIQYFDKTGEIIIDLEQKHLHVSDFSEGLAWVLGTNQKWGLINKQGEEITACIYENATQFSNGISVAKKDGKYGVIDPSGKLIVSHKYDGIGDFSEGIAFVNQGGYGLFSSDVSGGKFGYIDKTGKEVIPCKYDAIQFFTEKKNTYRVVQDGKYGFYSLDKKVSIPPIYENAAILPREDLVAVKLNGAWGFVNQQNKQIIPFMYDKVTSFKKGYAEVLKNGLWYFINKSNKMIPRPKASYWLSN